MTAQLPVGTIRKTVVTDVNGFIVTTPLTFTNEPSYRLELHTGSWTNTVNFHVLGTNHSNAYAVKGRLGFSGNVTNNQAPGLSNVIYFCDGIVTNRTFIP